MRCNMTSVCLIKDWFFAPVCNIENTFFIPYEFCDGVGGTGISCTIQD